MCLVEIAILCWVKFYKFDVVVAWVATALLIPIIFIFIAFAAHFYLKVYHHIYLTERRIYVRVCMYVTIKENVKRKIILQLINMYDKHISSM